MIIKGKLLLFICLFFSLFKEGNLVAQDFTQYAFASSLKDFSHPNSILKFESLNAPESILCDGPDLSLLPTLGHQSHYKMIGNANDSKNNNHGIIVNNPSSTTDRYDNANNAYLLNSGLTQYITTSTLYNNPTSNTVSIWFKGKSAGGKLIGFGNSQYGASTEQDRHIYMTNNGQLIFGVFFSGAARTIRTVNAYNDDSWHMVTASYGPTYGIRLYVDGILISEDATVTGARNSTGYWRMGYDAITGFPEIPGSLYYNGSLDDAHIYNRELTPAEVSVLFSSGSNSPVCQGGTLNLNAKTIPGASYSWAGPNGFSSILQNPSISDVGFGHAGVYTLTATVDGCATVSTEHILVNIHNNSPNISQVPTLGLLSHYKLDGNFNDETGENYGIAQYAPNIPIPTTDRYGLPNRAYTLDGSSHMISTTRKYAAPNNYTISVWFKTSTTSGGKLIGFGSATVNASGTYDRHIWMSNDGRVHYGVSSGGNRILSSVESYNDNEWHMATATLSANGMKFYVDGKLIDVNPAVTAGATYWLTSGGYWRYGYDAINWAPAPTSPRFGGSLDDIMIYNRELSSGEISVLFNSPNGAGAYGTICPGINLNLSATSVTGASYLWSGPNDFSSTLQNPTITNASAANIGRYTVEISAEGCKSTAYAVYSESNIAPPTGTGASRCGPGSVTLNASGASNYRWYDAASGGTLLGTASSYATPSISSSTTYYVAAFDGTCESASRTAVVATINSLPDAPITTPGSNCGPGNVTLSASGSAGTYNWYDVPSGGVSLATTASFITPSISANTTYYVASVENGCEGSRASVLASINTLPSAPTASGQNSCGVDPVILEASGGNDYRWYDASSGGTLIASGTPFTTTVSSTTTYHVSSLSAEGCESETRTAVIVTVPKFTPYITETCGNNTSGAINTYTGWVTNFTMSGTGTIWVPNTTNWQNPDGSTTAIPYDPNNTISQKIVEITGGNPGKFWQIANINTTGMSNIQLYFNGRRNNNNIAFTDLAIEIYNNGVLVATLGPVTRDVPEISTTSWARFTTNATGTSIPATNNLAVRFVNLNGSGARNFQLDDFYLTTDNLPAPTTLGATRCNAGTLTLSALGASNFNWYNESTGGTLLSTGSSYTTPSLTSTTTYYVASGANGCESPRAPVVATIANISAPATTPGARCGTGTVNLSASGSAGTYNWYNVPSGGVSLGTSASFTTPSISTSTTYYVASVENGCEGPRASVEAAIVSGSVGGSLDSPATVCSGNNSGAITLSGHIGYVIGWESSLDNFATPGSAIANTTTSLNYENLTQTTSYRAIVEASGCTVENSSSVTITVNPIPSAPTTTAGSRCGEGTVSLSASGSTGTYNWYDVPSGGVSLETAASFTTPSITTSTLFYVASVENGCEGSRAEVVATITSASVGGALSSPATVCSGNNSGTITLSGHIGDVTGWESSLDNFATVGTAIPNTNNTLYYENLTQNTSYRAIVEALGCTAENSSTVTIAISPLPSAPTTTAGSRCGEGTVSLSASGSIGTYNWYDVASGGVLLETAASFTTPSLATTKSYFVASVEDGCEGARAEVIAEISLPSDAGNIEGVQVVCKGQNSGILEIINYTGSVSQWETSIDMFDTYTVEPNQNSLFSYNNIENTTYYRAIITSGSCPADTTPLITVAIDDSPMAEAGILKGDTIVLGMNNYGKIILTDYIGEIIGWEYSEDGFNSYSTLNNQSSQYFYDNLSITTYFRVIIKSGICNAVVSNVVKVEVIDSEKFEIFNSITRNDDGINDDWYIKGIEMYPNNKVTIINRWGQIVYREQGYNNSDKVWKGQGNTGLRIDNNKLPDGTYFYEVDLGNGVKPISGYVIIKD